MKELAFVAALFVIAYVIVDLMFNTPHVTVRGKRWCYRHKWELVGGRDFIVQHCTKCDRRELIA